VITITDILVTHEICRVACLKYLYRYTPQFAGVTFLKTPANDKTARREVKN
jgi:hypothetical protein